MAEGWRPRHLRKDGKPDMRFKENRDRLLPSGRNVDGTMDRRTKEYRDNDDGRHFDHFPTPEWDCHFDYKRGFEQEYFTEFRPPTPDSIRNEHPYIQRRLRMDAELDTRYDDGRRHFDHFAWRAPTPEWDHHFDYKRGVEQEYLTEFRPPTPDSIRDEPPYRPRRLRMDGEPDTSLKVSTGRLHGKCEDSDDALYRGAPVDREYGKKKDGSPEMRSKVNKEREDETSDGRDYAVTEQAAPTTSVPKILVFNVGTLKKRVDELDEVASKRSVDIIALSETWLNSDIKDDEVKIPGFKFFRTDRDHPWKERGGGVGAYVSTSYNARKLSSYGDDDIESLWLTIGLPHHTLLLCVVYHAPDSTADQNRKLLRHLQSNVDKFLKKHPDALVVVTGDFNPPRFTRSKQHALSGHQGLTQLIKCGTRKGEVLDLCFVNEPELFSEPVQLPKIEGSDHDPILIAPAKLPRRPRRVRKDGQPDMRFKENRDELLPSGRNQDGSLDRRTRECKEILKTTPKKMDGRPDMRFKVNRELLPGKNKGNNGTLDRRPEANREYGKKKDGTPDMRFKVNKEIHGKQTTPEAPLRISSVPLKKDGTPDKRFKVNRKPFGDTSITNNDGRHFEQFAQPPTPESDHYLAFDRVSGQENFTEFRPPPPAIIPDELPGRPGRCRKDVKPDMRYKENRDRLLPQGRNVDGSPDMRCRENRDRLLPQGRNVDESPDKRTKEYIDVPKENPKQNDGGSHTKFKVKRELLQGKSKDDYWAVDRKTAGNREYGKNGVNRNLLISSRSLARGGNYSSSSTYQSFGSYGSSSPSCDSGSSSYSSSSTYQSFGSYGSSSPSRDSVTSYSSSSAYQSTGPLRKDGKPDMRYKANKESYSSSKPSHDSGTSYSSSSAFQVSGAYSSSIPSCDSGSSGTSYSTSSAFQVSGSYSSSSPSCDSGSSSSS